MTQHEEYMYRCLELAKKGSPHTWPNPLVGCVIVCEGKIIGEGYHQQLGGAHAEVNAIESVANPNLLRKSTLYVNLEPCSHFGKTPPCANLIVEHKIPEVVCAMTDPNPQVAGTGIKRLMDAGCHVTLGTLEWEASELNRSFITFHQQKRPYIILKWARTSDGFMGRHPGDQRSKSISCPASNHFVHQLRAESGALVIGRNTAIQDNPTLTTRLVSGRSPHRIILSHEGDLPTSLNLLNDEGKTTVLSGDIRTTFQQLTDLCFEHQYTQVLVEGGAEVLSNFLLTEMWDEAIEIISPMRWEDGIKSPVIPPDLLVDSIEMDADRINFYRPK